MNRKALIEALQYVLILVVLIANITVILKTQAETRQARKANMERQSDMIDHFDCVVLLTKKYPNVKFQELTYEQSKDYLDKCAKS